MITIEDLEKADHSAADMASKSVESTWKADMLREDSKDMLAVIMTRIKRETVRQDGKVSEAELEREARATKEWKDYRNGQFEAQHQALEDKVKAQNAQRHFEAVQSALSYRREEFKRLGT